MAARVNTPVVSMDTELKLILDTHNVRPEIQEFLLSDDVQCKTVTQFAVIVTEEKELVKDLLEEAGLDKIKIGDKIAVRGAWSACRATLSGSAEKTASSSAAVSKMPDGAEARLRDAWKDLHRFNLSGAWLTSEEVMTKLYKGLMATPKHLYVPDVASIGRRCALSQKPMRGTLFTDYGIENMDFTLNPCTTHPDIFLRIRAYVMTISWISVITLDFLPYETAVDVVDFIFEAINMRADGKRPSLQCITQCFLSMFSEYAKCLQNEQTVLDLWLKEKSNWHHYWKESIVSFDQSPSTGDLGPQALHAASAALPIDIGNMVQSNNNLIRSFQGQMDRRFQSLADHVKSQSKDGGRGKKGDKANWQGGNDQLDGQADGQQQSQGDAGKRKNAKDHGFHRRGKRVKSRE